MENFSIEKVLALVKSLDRNFYEPAFREKFKQPTEKELSEMEKDFASNCRN